MHCHLCGKQLSHDYGDHLCHTCFLTRGLEIVVDLLSSQVQQTLFESFVALGYQAHQREQTDAAYHALRAAYHAAYQPTQLEIVIHEAERRFQEWREVLDECGEVRADDYHVLIAEARELHEDMIAATGGEMLPRDPREPNAYARRQ